MMSHTGSSRRLATLVLVALLHLTASGTLLAKEEGSGETPKTTKTQDGVRVDDLPGPIPGLMKSIQDIGNSIGEGISKATSEGARAVKKAVKGEGEKKDKR